MLEKYGDSLSKTTPPDLEKCINVYEIQRKKAFDDHFAAGEKLQELEEATQKSTKEKKKITERIYKANKNTRKGKEEKARKKAIARQEKVDAKHRLKEERSSFWPKQVYRVVISLESLSDLTPASSRRNSTDSLVKLEASAPEKESSGRVSPSAHSEISLSVSLSVSYVTYSASWSPRYDLSLITPSKSGSIVYRAEFRNTTSETWRDAKVILSTSQTTFQGLGDPIPVLTPWHIRLGKFRGVDESLYSSNEQMAKERPLFAGGNKPVPARNDLFGVTGVHDVYQQQHMMMQHRQMLPGIQQSQAKPQAQQNNPFGGFGNTQPSSGGLFGGTQPSVGGLFGSSVNANNAYPDSHATRQQLASRAPRVRVLADEDPSDVEAELESADEAETMIEADQALAFQESTWEETGMTATYDVPGSRTIPPSNRTRRHKIATITLKDVDLSYVLVPKLRAAAFLKARLRNNSSTTLLRGPAGLTLDGSFLGNTTIQRCSAGEAFNLSLGVDPGVSVVYGKPTVHRSQSGVFQKEGSCVYTRTCTVTNTKANNAIKGIVLDQVPVSEDDKLRVEILQPRGLKGEGDRAKSGTGVERERTNIKGNVYSLEGARGVQGKEEKWGTAVATFKKAGQVCWDVKVNAGQGVRLVLEYEARFPGSDTIVQV